MKIATRSVLFACLFSFAAAAAALAAGGKPSLPAGMKGFSGVLRGTVVEAQADGRGFVIEVTEVVRTNAKSTAPAPADAVGKRLLVNAQWEKGAGGKWHPVETHVRFIRTLKRGERLDIEVVNDEGERLHILELTKDQRDRANVR